MHVDADMYARIVELYRAQPAHRRPNHQLAARLCGVDRRTLTSGYVKGWPRTRNRPALPPIKEIIEADERAAAVAPPAEEPLCRAVEEAACSSPAPPLAPEAPRPSEAPVPPPVVRTVPADPVSAQPDPVAVLRDAAAKALLQELDILKAARANAVGLLVTSQVLLKALHDGAPQIRAKLMALTLEKPERAIALLGELAKIEAETVRSAERLVATQRVIAGLPSTITEHRVGDSRPPESAEQTAARVRAVIAELAAANRGLDDYGRPLRIEPIDVAATEG